MTPRQALRTGGLVVGLVLALGAALHLPVARGLLARLGDGVDCPVGQPASPAARESFRQAQLAPRLGEGSARMRFTPVGELAARADGGAQVLAWAQAHEATCTQAADTVACTFPAATDLRELRAFVGPTGEVVALDLWRRVSTEDSYARFTERVHAVRVAVGPETSRTGDLGAFTQASRYARVAATFAYADYRAVVSLARVGGGRLGIRERYEWVPTGSRSPS
ncbi:MAG: hypothetical protein R3B40_05945 [Polyangiales bacterium]